MKTALITHSDCLDHVTPPGHPEQVARMDAVLGALQGMDLHRASAPMAAEDDVLRVHPKSHLDMLRRAAPAEGWVSLDADTHLSRGTLAAVWRSAGGAVRAVDLVLGGDVANAFVAMRPPGHHAERTTAMGFCFFGNVAIAAETCAGSPRVCGGWRLLISMFTTVMARRIWLRMMRAFCSVPPTKARCTQVQGRLMKPVWTTMW